MSAELRVGMVAPMGYELVITSDEVGGVNLESVSAAEFVVRDPDEVVTTWAADLDYDEDDETLTVTRVFHATTSELTKAGVWIAFAKLTIPSGTVNTDPRALFVRGRFYVKPTT